MVDYSKSTFFPNNNISMRFVSPLICLLFIWNSSYAQVDVELVSIATGLTRPVDIAHAGDERLFVVEQAGRIRILTAERTLLAEPFLDIRSRVNDGGSEQGLLGLVFDPNFTDNGYFYVNYTRGNDDTVIARFQVDPADPNRALPDSEAIILTVSQPFRNHNAGDLAFGPDGYLYIPLGDGGSGNDPQRNGQDGNSFLGKILRIDPNGETPYAIPADNPFLNDPDIRDEIWALGLRNPWRISFDRTTGDLWIADVGQDTREEINRQPAASAGGENYGWRCFEGTLDLFGDNECPPDNDLVFPVHEYDHGGDAASITGGFVYRGAAFPGLTGRYFYADIVLGTLWSLVPQPDGSFENELLIADAPAVSTFGEDVNGELYLADLGAGTIFQVQDRVVTNTADAAILRSGIQLFPNPVESDLQLSITAEVLDGSLEWSVIDVQGRRLRNGRIATAGSVSISVADLPDGLYYLHLESVVGQRLVPFSKQ